MSYDSTVLTDFKYTLLIIDDKITEYVHTSQELLTV